MPFIRGCRTLSPVDNVTPGLWLELSSDPPGTWTGLAQSDWPNVVTTGPVAQQDTLETYAAKCNAALANLARKVLGGVSVQVVTVTVTFSSLVPLTLANVVIGEADMKATHMLRKRMGAAMGVLGLTYAG